MTRAFHDHAQVVLDHELRRARGRLAPLTRGEQAAVAAAAAHITAAVVDGVLDQARAEPRLARALASIYRSDAGLDFPRGS